ncbi:MAG: Gfo/Idh/MocA family oxidoreductase [Kiritimatiellae bacterium]|nr:Gfo/Idh/MocA family oxidoreductase [Kiritimatiellia bacterium]
MAEAVGFSILGAGRIAGKTVLAAKHLAARGSLRLRAVGARDAARAAEFASANGFEKSFGSYEALLADPATELVYVATPNSLHAAHAKACLLAGKHVICEKPFATNEREAAEVFALARERGLFCGEAMWTRFQPSWRAIPGIVATGRIGEPRLVEASFAVPVANKARLVDPKLGGGALLDLGVYPVAFAIATFGENPVRVAGHAVVTPSGVDDQSAFSVEWEGGRFAALSCSMSAAGGARGRLVGTEGSIELPELVRCESLRIVRHPGIELETMPFPFACNGYEYEFEAAARAVRAGLPECAEAPQSATLAAMRVMDALRASWGVRFPAD